MIHAHQIIYWNKFPSENSFFPHLLGFRIFYSHSREKVQFFETRLRIIFLLSPGETRSRLSYDHSRISRRERDYIMLFSCFETRSRLWKIISHGWARKNKTEFPGSRILVELCFIWIKKIFFSRKSFTKVGGRSTRCHTSFNFDKNQ